MKNDRLVVFFAFTCILDFFSEYELLYSYIYIWRDSFESQVTNNQ